MGETEAQRDERLQRILTTAVEPTAAALVAISLEDVGKDIEDQFLKLQGAYRVFGATFNHSNSFRGKFPILTGSSPRWICRLRNLSQLCRQDWHS